MLTAASPTSSLRRSRTASVRSAAVAGLLAAVAFMPTTAHAGFLEQLFGIEAQPAPAPQAPALQPETYSAAPRRERPIRRRVRVEVVGSGRQTPTDLMHDKTLHRGDAVMRDGGLYVYAGSGRGTHGPEDFVPLDKSDLSSKAKMTLATVEAPAEPLGMAGGTVVSGRSVSTGQPVVRGRTIEDAHGHAIRYVGP